MPVTPVPPRGPLRLADEVAFLRKCLIVLGLVALALAIWRVREAALLAFAAAVVAALLDTVARPIARLTGMARRWTVALAMVAILAALAMMVLLVGSQVWAQVGEFSERLPQAVRYVEGELGISIPFLNGSGGSLVSGEGGGGIDAEGLFGRITSLGSALAIGLTNIVLVVIGGVFLALDPRLYRNGLLKLVPAEKQERIGDALDTCGRSLELWVLGQAVSMSIVGLLAGLATWAIGVPAPLALGLFAGLAEFVPVIGAIAGAVPAVLLALTVDLQTAAWTVAAFLVIQQLESNLITPVVQLHMVRVPPALMLFSVLAFGGLFGLMGVLIAAPMTVVAFVLTQKLYVRETLGEDVKVAGEEAD